VLEGFLCCAPLSVRYRPNYRKEAAEDGGNAAWRVQSHAGLETAR
jgi:hypothetical protein